VYKKTRKPDEHGRGVTTETAFSAAGVVQATSGRDLERLDEGDRGNESITVWTDAALSIGSENDLPDEILYRGVRYLVRNVMDWKDYGQGWFQAICVAQSMKERAS
jgi:hypothetical protein